MQFTAYNSKEEQKVYLIHAAMESRAFRVKFFGSLLSTINCNASTFKIILDKSQQITMLLLNISCN